VDEGVGVGRANEGGVRFVRLRFIGDEAAMPSKQPAVLKPGGFG
jgi:hypothetical protein